MSIALLAQGFDPSLGIAHSDKEGRASLAYDMIEAARPYIDAWMVALLAETRFAAGDFDGDARGGVRVTRPLTSYLAYSLPLWRRAVEPVARWLAHVIMTGRPDPLPSPLASLPAPGRQWRTVMPAACWECGRALPAGRSRRFCSASCRGSFLSAMRRGEGSTGAAEIAAAVRAGDETRRARLSRSAAERRQWAEQHVGDDRERLRQWYRERLAPAVAGLTIAAVAEALGVSRLYARQLVRDGGVPHPRHFAALARLAGVELPKMLR